MFPSLPSIMEFVALKKSEHYSLDDFHYVVPGGSYVSGTFDETSDFDFRSIVTLDENHYFGLHQFSHQKMVSGALGMNTKDDMDVEVFELFTWLKGLIAGEIIPFEMAYIDPKLLLLKGPILTPVLENLDLFLSKKVVGNYFGFVQKCKHRMYLPADRFEKEISKNRVNTFGYETKEAMNIVKILRLTNELMQTGKASLLRPDAEELLAIKHGQLSQFQVEQVIEELLIENKQLFKADNLLPKDTNFEKVSAFVRDYKKFAFQTLGMI